MNEYMNTEILLLNKGNVKHILEEAETTKWIEENPIHIIKE